MIILLADVIPPAGAVAKLRLGDFQHDGTQYVLRFQEKGGKSREIPVRHDLEGFILAYVESAGIAAEAKERPLFRASNGKTKRLSEGSMNSKTYRGSASQARGRGGAWVCALGGPHRPLGSER